MTDEEPRVSAEEMIARLEPALSPWKRARGVAALVAGVAGTVFVTALWWGEPVPLPGRTQLAFGLFTLFCLAWACYGGWLLARRTPLFATDRVVAGWLALAASTATTALMVAVTERPVAGLVGGGTFVAVSAVLTVRAHARRAALLRRARELRGRDG